MCSEYVYLARTDEFDNFLRSRLQLERERLSVATPGKSVPVLRTDVSHEAAKNRVDPMRWGFVPSWKRSWNERHRPVNARFESAASNELFRKSFASKRAALPAVGFVAWRRSQRGSVERSLVQHEDGSELAMAALWDAWADPRCAVDDPSRWRYSVVLLTGPVPGLGAGAHDRQPICLAPDAMQRWLDPSLNDNNQLTGLLSEQLLKSSNNLVRTEVSQSRPA